VPTLALVLLLVVTLAGDGEDVVVDLDRDVVLAHPGEVGAKQVMVLDLDEVHRRAPALGAPRLRGEQSVEQAAYVRAEGIWLGQKRHFRYLLGKSGVLARQYKT
jgi:hypothetical protein